MACVAGVFQWGRSSRSTTTCRVGNYRLEQTLGKGTYGEVRKATNVVTGKPAAVKLVRGGKMNAEALRAEIDNHRRLDHPHIVRIIETFRSGGDTYIAMELMPGGNLLAHLNTKQTRLPEREARWFFQQLVIGVAHCHSCGVVHRDLKLENLMLDADKNLKIADFGLSATMIEGEKLTISVGSLAYAAPELLSPNVSYDGPEIDVWSCGVILYVLLTGRLPFCAANNSELKRSIQEGQYKIPFYFRPEAKDLLSKMLSLNSRGRIITAEIRKHKWWQTNLIVESGNTPSHQLERSQLQMTCCATAFIGVSHVLLSTNIPS